MSYATIRVGELARAERRLKDARMSLESAKKEYGKALQECTDLGMSNIKMGCITDLSEAAIRMYKQRHDIRGSRR